MKRIARIATLLLTLMLPAALSACERGRSAQIAAIEAAVTAFDGIYFELDDLTGQIERQAPKRGTGADEAYDLAVRVPDYASAAFNNIPFAMPPVDYHNPNISAYRAEVCSSMRASYEAYARAHACDAYADATLRVELFRTNSGWEASFAPASVEALNATIDAEFENLLSAREQGMREFELLDVASRKDEFLSWIFEDAGLVSATKILSIAVLAPGSYDVLIQYPDVSETYTYLGDRLYLEQTSPVFDEVTVRLSGTEDDAADFERMAQQTANIRVRYQGGAAVPEDDGALWLKWYEAKAAAEKETSLRIESKWLVTAKPLPRAGVITGESRGNEITMMMPENDVDTHCYMEFYQISGLDLNEDGALALGVFVPNGKSASAKLPAGSYKLLAHCGAKWYGPGHAFGAEDAIFLYTKAIEITDGESLTVAFDITDAADASGFVPVN